MGGVLEVAEIPGFLGNLNELYAAADSDGRMWREFTGAWWEAYREEPKRVSELTKFCEERDLMLNVRGDGSERSQQTRLGKALGVKRDRVFNGLTVKQASKSHRTGILYVLAPADGSNPGGRPSGNLNLLDALDGDGGETSGDAGAIEVSPDRPHRINRFPRVGRRGRRWRPFKRSLRAKNTRSRPEYRRRREIARKLHGEERRKQRKRLPRSPQRVVTDTKHERLDGETFGANVSPTSPQRPHAESGGVIDLARLPDARAVHGKDPP